MVGFGVFRLSAFELEVTSFGFSGLRDSLLLSVFPAGSGVAAVLKPQNILKPCMECSAREGPCILFGEGFKSRMIAATL